MAISNQPLAEKTPSPNVNSFFLLNPLTQYKIPGCKGVYISTGKEVVE
jgi:hypothetical protein